ncbi:GTPase [Aureococcus anophagefferens]|nr:GTPase [Aureococcus anophagefferens]
MYAEFPNAALPLVEVREGPSEGPAGWSMSANDDTLKLLSTIEERVCVVTVVGLYRSGKSSLLNWLRDPEKPGGFAVGHGVSRCTKGIWVWGRPAAITLEDGSSAALLLLDTEGLGGLGVDGSYDATIFSLAALLASTLAYNSLGALDEHAISNLGFVARLSASVRARPAERADRDDAVAASQARHELSRHLPAFLWVLRDFALDLVDEDGTAIDSDAYLERALAPRGNSSQDSTRQALLGYFARRGCATLPRPHDSEAALNGGATLTPRPAFVGALDALRERLFAGAQPKRVDGVPLPGGTFGALVSRYVRAFAEGATPTIQTAWADVVRRSWRRPWTGLRRARRGGRADEAAFHAAHVAGCRACDDALRAHGGDVVGGGGGDLRRALGEARCCDAARRRSAARRGARCSRVHAAPRGRRPGPRARATLDGSALAYADGDDAERHVRALSGGRRGETRAPRRAARRVRRRGLRRRVVLRGVPRAPRRRGARRRRRGRVDGRELGGLRARVARLEGAEAAVEAGAEACRRRSVADRADATRLRARVGALEAELGEQRDVNAALGYEAESAKAELEDATAALASEEAWQRDLQDRLDEKISEHAASQRALREKVALLETRSNHYQRKARRYTVLDLLLENADDAAEKLDASTEEFETFLVDLDMGLDLLPKLRELGAKSVDDLRYLEPEDFDDLDLPLVKRRRLADAVVDVKAHLNGRGRRRNPEGCALA